MVPYHGFYALGRGTRHLAHPGARRRAAAHHNSLVKRDPGYFDRMFEPLTSGALGATIITDTLLTGSGSPWEDLGPSLSHLVRDGRRQPRAASGDRTIGLAALRLRAARGRSVAAAGADSGRRHPRRRSARAPPPSRVGSMLAHDEPAAEPRHASRSTHLTGPRASSPSPAPASFPVGSVCPSPARARAVLFGREDRADPDGSRARARLERRSSVPGGHSEDHHRESTLVDRAVEARGPRAFAAVAGPHHVRIACAWAKLGFPARSAR